MNTLVSPDLNKGITLANLRSLGTTPVLRDKVKICVKGWIMKMAILLTRLDRIASCPTEESFSSEIMLGRKVKPVNTRILFIEIFKKITVCILNFVS